MQKYKTRQRQFLLNFLKAHADEAFSAEQVFQFFCGDSISISAVYRNLASLEKEGVIHRVTKGGSKKAFYRYSNAEHCRDHLHISCVKCGCTFHVDEKTTNDIIKRVKNRAGFLIDSSSTMFYGVCKNCNNLKENTAV